MAEVDGPLDAGLIGAWIDPGLHARALGSCERCVTLCREAAASAVGDDSPEVADALSSEWQFSRDCAELCELTIRMLVGELAFHPMLARDVVRATYTSCLVTAAACAGSDVPIVRECADACRECADVCSEVATTLAA